MQFKLLLSGLDSSLAYQSAGILLEDLAVMIASSKASPC
jgi:hypothetical protein